MALALTSTFRLPKRSWRGVRVSLFVLGVGWLTLEKRGNSRETVGIFSHCFKLEFIITATCPIVLSTISPLRVLNLEGQNYVALRCIVLAAVDPPSKAACPAGVGWATFAESRVCTPRSDCSPSCWRLPIPKFKPPRADGIWQKGWVNLP